MCKELEKIGVKIVDSLPLFRVWNTQTTFQIYSLFFPVSNSITDGVSFTNSKSIYFDKRKKSYLGTFRHYQGNLFISCEISTCPYI